MVSRTRALSKLLNTDNKIAETSFSQDIVLGPEQYATPDDLPFVGNSVGDQAFVASNNRLYIWSGSGWYSVALINTNPSFDSGGLPLEQYSLNSDNPSALITLLATDPEGVPITYSATTDSGSDFVTILQGSGDSSNIFTVNLKSLDSIVSSGYDSSFEAVFDITFKASDGINLASALSEFTITFVTTIENSKYTTLLMKAVNTDTNSSFTDASTNSHTITANGDVHAGTFSPYRSGGYSYYFDGSGDYLTVPYGSWVDFGTDDFTIELWLQSSKDRSIVIDTRTDSNAGWMISIDPTNFYMYVTGGANPVSTPSSNLPDGQFNHIAITRYNGLAMLYINGELKNSNEYTSNINGGDDFRIGSKSSSTSTVGDLNGYISDLRIIKGTAVYTSNFTPPTERLTAITNTELLTCHLPYIVDGSSNEHTITVNGNTSTQPFSPFDYDKYDPEVHGGSAYFDGAGDFLSIPNDTSLQLGNSEFTIEAWIYPTAIDSGGTSVIMGKYNPAPNLEWFLGITSSVIRIRYSVNGSSVVGNIDASYAVSLNTWTHIAVSRVGNNLKFFANGVQIGSDVAFSSTFYQGTGTFQISSANNDDTSRFIGYVSNIRIVKGTALYTSNFTPPTAPLTAIPNTSLLINGTDGSIIDYSGSQNLKLFGNTAGSNTQVKNASYSVYFDGSGDYIRADNALSEFTSATDKFTIEAWIRPTASWVQADRWLGINTKSAGSNIILIGMDSIFGNWSNSFNTPMTLNAWNHFALTYNGSTATIYINGNQDISATVSFSVSLSDCVLGIGAEFDAANGGNVADFFTGYIEDLRITKDLVRYTASFTPPVQELTG